MKENRYSFDGKTVNLISLCHSITDCHHSTPEYIDKGKLVIRNYNIKDGRLLLMNSSYTTDENFFQRIKRAKPEGGDLIITREAPMGEVCIIPNGLECCLGQRMVLIKPNLDKVDNRYLLYALQSEFVQTQINKSNGTGSIVSNLRIPLLEQLKIPDIDTLSQTRIGSILGDIDAKIELNNKINAELEAMAKLIYDYWFVQFDFPIDKDTAEKMGNPSLEGKPYKASGGKMVYNKELKREIPEGWRSGFLSDIGDIVGGSTPSKAVEEYFCNQDGTPWITPKDLSNNAGKKYITRGECDVTEAGIKSASLKLMPKGTVLLSSRAPIGYLAISREPVTTNQGFKSFVPRSIYSSEFIYYAVQKSIKTIEANASGSTFKEVSTSTLKTIMTILPLEKILNNYDSLIKPIFKKQDILEKQNQKLSELRDWLLPMLMNGQVRVMTVDEL